MNLEKVMLSQEVFIPVYFATWSSELQEIVDDVAHSMITDEKAGTAAQGTVAFLNKRFTTSNLQKITYFTFSLLWVRLNLGPRPDAWQQ